jgi:hypothetical protein
MTVVEANRTADCLVPRQVAPEPFQESSVRSSQGSIMTRRSNLPEIFDRFVGIDPNAAGTSFRPVLESRYARNHLKT